MATSKIDQLAALLNTDLQSLDLLDAALQQEHQALEKNTSEALESATREKNALLEQLRERARQKVHLLVDLGYRPDKGAPSAFLEHNGAPARMLELWHRAQSRLEDCQRQNAVNGRIISHMQRRLTRMADILRGNDRSQRLYGAAGQTQNLNHNSVLASV